ncbi:MAG TPA: GNAT family N-acetyltransferase [Lachnospiraceae bacterium]|nr:GNAT family N-acetyltransferase [Lachnospiraceae bacterium]
MELLIKEYGEYKEDEIMKLYNSVGWINYTTNPAMLKNAFQNSLKVYGAYEDNKLLGIVRVVGDGYSIIYIQDILILPEYQHQGIGTKLLIIILDTYKNVYQKSLLTDHTEKNLAFYKSLGFDMDTDMGCRAFLKNY